MKVLVLGGDGMLGHKVHQVLDPRFEVYATFRRPDGLWTRFPQYEAADPARLFGGVDAADLQGIVGVLARVRPDVVINCIGIIKQLPQASDPIAAISVNSLFPHHLATLCQAARARLIHLSTDCVFSGRKGNYTEDDVSDALDLYGRSKFLGELHRPGCLTIRTSIFGRDFLKQSSLLEWFLSHRGGQVQGYRNAVFTGFPTRVLARIIGDVIADHSRLDGLYHVASQPITKHDLLVMIREAMHLDLEIVPYDDPPCDRSLLAARFAAATGYRIPAWTEMIAELAADPTPYDDWKERHGTAP